MNLEDQIKQIEIPELRLDILSMFYASEAVGDCEAIQEQISKAVEEMLSGDFMSADERLSRVAMTINESFTLPNET